MDHPIIIVGAGLSGLTIAYLLKKEGIPFKILEARDRLGGRIFTQTTETHNNLEMGATWFGFKHERLKNLLALLNLDHFEQYQAGESTLVFNSMSPAHRFIADTTAPPSYRIANGSVALINALAQPISENIILNSKILAIENQSNGLNLVTKNGDFEAKKLIITIPPRLAVSSIDFKPALDDQLIEAMRATPTWMEHAVKFVLTFKEPFWRKEGKSGMLISQIGPATEVYDHVNYSNNEFSLMGFVNDKMKDYDKNERKGQIIDFLTQHLGKGILNHIDYVEKDWSMDPFTAAKQTGRTRMHPTYGNTIYNNSFYNGRLYFSGTETATHFGGYMEGAVYAAEQTVNSILRGIEDG